VYSIVTFQLSLIIYGIQEAPYIHRLYLNVGFFEF